MRQPNQAHFQVVLPGGGTAASQKLLSFPLSTADSGPFWTEVSSVEEAAKWTDSKAAKLRRFVAGFSFSAEVMAEPTREGMGQVETIVAAPIGSIRVLVHANGDISASLSRALLPR